MSLKKDLYSVEDAILAAKNKKIYPKDLLQKILENEFYLVCDENVLSSKKIMLPLCIEIDSQKYICVFTNRDWVNQYLNPNTVLVKLKAMEVLRIIPKKYGLIINPNYDASVKFDSSGIQNILRDFK